MEVARLLKLEEIDAEVLLVLSVKRSRLRHPGRRQGPRAAQSPLEALEAAAAATAAATAAPLVPPVVVRGAGVGAPPACRPRRAAAAAAALDSDDDGGAYDNVEEPRTTPAAP